MTFCPKRYKKCERVFEYIEELADKLYHISNLLFAKFDPEKNDNLDGLPVIYFPTIRFYTTTDKFPPHSFFANNTFTFENLDNFVKDHLTVLDYRYHRAPKKK